ncbi:MAG: hypothetical protein Q4Q22_05175 [Methanosphaera sp.]|nr:hypothetical protein [Methanosphaera sp.]
MKRLLDKLERTFRFKEDEEIEEYLKSCYFRVLKFTEDDFNIIKIAMQENINSSEKKLLFSKITDTIISKLDEFFKLQIQKKIIKEITPQAISIMCFSLIFQSLILWQIYGSTIDVEPDYYADDFLNILFNGIKT